MKNGEFTDTEPSSSGKYCGACGAWNVGHALFCVECGWSWDSDEPDRHEKIIIRGTTTCPHCHAQLSEECIQHEEEYNGDMARFWLCPSCKRTFLTG